MHIQFVFFMQLYKKNSKTLAYNIHSTTMHTHAQNFCFYYHSAIEIYLWRTQMTVALVGEQTDKPKTNRNDKEVSVQYC